MHLREIASIIALGAATVTIGIGCGGDDKAAPKPDSAKADGKKDKKGDHGDKKGDKADDKKADDKKADDKKADDKGGAAAKLGTATIKGVVNFTGKAPEMKVPKKRKDAEFCKNKEVKYNSVIVNGGKLQDVFVRLSNESVKGDFKAPDKHAEIAQQDCMYTPRIQGVVSGQTIDIKNSDDTLHNVHTYKGTESWFNKPQTKGAPAIAQEMPEENKVVKFQCDVHPWMRGFVVVNSHPFFAVSGADGTFTIANVPAGKYDIEAWHPTYGLKKSTVEVADGAVKDGITFTYDGTEPEPTENKDETKDLF